VSRLTNLPCFVAMRLWHPTVEEVLPMVRDAGVSRLCLLPLAQFSVDVYSGAARGAIVSSGAADIEVVSTPNWSRDPAYLDAQAQLIERYLPDGDCTLILTAHSLPTVVIARGDRYARDAQACSAAIAHRL